MKKILFPFYKKGLLLKKYWWHRLFIVLFFLTVITIGLFPLYTTFKNHSSRNALCFTEYERELQSNIEAYPKNVQTFGINTAVGFSKADDDLTKGILSICLDNDWSNYIGDLKLMPIFGIIFAILVSYGLQLIYYKIFIYVIFGKGKDCGQ